MYYWYKYVVDRKCYILGISILLQTLLLIPGKEEEKTHNVQRDPQWSSRVGTDHTAHKGVGGDQMHPQDKIKRLVL